LSTAYTECCVPCHVNERNVEDDIDQTRYLDIKEDVELFGRWKHLCISMSRL